MSKILSGQGLAGYKRWQVPDVAVGDGRNAYANNNKYLTAVQLEKIQKQAYDEAYSRGFLEGQSAGQTTVKEKAKVFTGMAAALAAPINDINDQVEHELLQLCMAISKQIIRREITIDPGHIISVIREALSSLPVSSQKVRIYLHPDDVVMVRNVLGELNIDMSFSLVDDITITRGGCRVLTENSQIDASLEARLSVIASKIIIDERKDGLSE